MFMKSTKMRTRCFLMFTPRVNIYVHPRGEHKKFIKPYVSTFLALSPSISFNGLFTMQESSRIF